MSRNFFEDFIRKDFFEKEASENANIKSALGEISPEVLEKLADELGVISQDDMLTLEEKLASDNEEEEEKKESFECEKKDEDEKESSDDKEEEEKKESSECEKKDEDEKESSDNEDEEEKESSECEKKDEDEKESSDNEDEEEKESSDDEDEEEKKESSECEKKDEDEKESSDNEDEEEKESSDDEEKEEENSNYNEEVLKQAYEVAEQRLVENGFSLEDYIFDKCANEEVTYFIAENAEKLAFLTDKNVLQVADNIIDTLAEKLR